MDKDLRIAVLEERNAFLEEQVALLESALITKWNPPVEWDLTGQEARVFGVLMGREMATKEAVMAALYDAYGREQVGAKIVDVFVSKIRKKLKPFDIQIKTVWGRGYTLVDREKFRRAA